MKIMAIVDRHGLPLSVSTHALHLQPPPIHGALLQCAVPPAAAPSLALRNARQRPTPARRWDRKDIERYVMSQKTPEEVYGKK